MTQQEKSLQEAREENRKNQGSTKSERIEKIESYLAKMNKPCSVMEVQTATAIPRRIIRRIFQKDYLMAGTSKKMSLTGGVNVAKSRKGFVRLTKDNLSDGGRNLLEFSSTIKKSWKA